MLILNETTMSTSKLKNLHIVYTHRQGRLVATKDAIGVLVTLMMTRRSSRLLAHVLEPLGGAIFGLLTDIRVVHSGLQTSGDALGILVLYYKEQ